MDWILFGAAGLLALWGFLYPLPYRPCIILLGTGTLAALALPRLTKGAFRLVDRNHHFVGVGDAALILSITLAVRALMDFNLIDWVGPLLVAAATGILFAFFAPVIQPPTEPSSYSRSRARAAVSFLLIGLVFGWGATVEANVLLDRSEPGIFRMRVEDKWPVTGRYRSWHLRLAPESEGPEGGDYRVDGSLYARVPIGQLVCVHQWQGYFGFRWYSVETCPTAAAS
jgi:hypothetical protein